MNDYLLAALLGVVEGLTEFLPVSSTAHLRICQALMGINLADGYWKMFSIVIQLGAILSLLFYFRTTLLSFLSDFFGGARKNRTLLQHPLILILIAFICTAVPSFLLAKVIGENLENIVVMGTSLIVGGIVMWIVDICCANRGKETARLEEVGLGQSIWVGLCQILSAVFPGTSRSMATIAGGQVGGMSRSVALEFSFLLSIPTMIAATGYDLLKTLYSGNGGNAVGATSIDAHGAMLLLIGGVVSFLVAYIVVAWFMHWVRRHGFVPFAIYRIVIGAIVLLFAGKLTV